LLFTQLLLILAIKTNHLFDNTFFMKDRLIMTTLIMVCLLFWGTASRAQDGFDRSATEIVNDMVPG
jgi:hypothetical protein